ncbi:MAG: MASE1 domain-containing protein [Steroidobacteraceae bacterium]
MKLTRDLQGSVPARDPAWDNLTLQLGGERTVFAAFVLLYALLVWLGYEFKETTRQLTVLWPAAGLLCVALWLAPRRLWPAFLGMQIVTGLAVSAVMGDPHELGWALSFVLANAVDAVVSALLLRALDSRHEGVRIVRLLQYLLASAVGASISATIGALAATHSYSPGYWHQWQLWWAGSWLGSLTVGPVVYAWSLPFRSRFAQLKLRSGWEISLYLAVLLPVTVWIFTGDAGSVLRMPAILLALLVGVGFRLPPRWSMLVVAAIVFVAAEVGTRGNWLLAADSAFLRVLHLQMHLAMFAVVSYLLTNFVAELRITLGRVSESEARYRSFIEMSSEAVWRIELDVPMPVTLAPQAQRDWLRRHAYVAECNTHFAQLAGGGLQQRWREDEPWNAVFEQHIEQAAADSYNLDGLRFSAGSGTRPRNFIIAFSGVVVQGSLQRIWGVARDITEIAELNTRLLREQERLKSYARQIMTAEERARRATAVDLHDGIAQSLVGMAMTLEVARRQASPELQVLIDETRANLRQVQERTRNMIADLSPPGLYELGLCPALQWMAVYFRGHDRLQVELDCKVNEASIPMELRVLIFKLVRELLRNVVKHAGVRYARVTARGDQDRLSIEVMDAGRGFEWQMDLFGERNRGFGLWSIADRVSEVGGEFKVDTAPGRGARFELRFALRRCAGEDAGMDRVLPRAG